MDDREQRDNPIVTMFEWWNRAMAPDGELSQEAFAEHYCEDGTLIVNGSVRAIGPAALVEHYRGVKSRCDHVELVLPVEEAFTCSDRAFVHCRTSVSIAGSTSAEEAMAYAVLRNGKMALLRVVSKSV